MSLSLTPFHSNLLSRSEWVECPKSTREQETSCDKECKNLQSRLDRNTLRQSKMNRLTVIVVTLIQSPPLPPFTLSPLIDRKEL